MTKLDKDLKGTDKILNLKEIIIYDLNSFSSSSCSGSVGFYIECQTEQGYCEDPRFLGKIVILNTKRDKEKHTYTLKVRFEQEDD